MDGRHTRSAWRALCWGAAGGLLLLCPAGLSAEEGYVVEMGSYPVRSGAGLSSGVIGRIKVGEKIQVLGRSSGWAQIASPDIRGWVVETGIGAEPPAVVSVGPLQEQLAALETRVGGLEEEKKTLQEENARLATEAVTLGQEVRELRAAAGPRRERLWMLGTGGALVIFGWIVGFAFSRRRGPTGRYRIE